MKIFFIILLVSSSVYPFAFESLGKDSPISNQIGENHITDIKWGECDRKKSPYFNITNLELKGYLNIGSEVEFNATGTINKAFEVKYLELVAIFERTRIYSGIIPLLVPQTFNPGTQSLDFKTIMPFTPLNGRYTLAFRIRNRWLCELQCFYVEFKIEPV